MHFLSGAQHAVDLSSIPGIRQCCLPKAAAAAHQHGACPAHRGGAAAHGTAAEGYYGYIDPVERKQQRWYGQPVLCVAVVRPAKSSLLQNAQAGGG